ncbi:MAG: protein-L-isoaspartate(D-aspartate) O-methyltransferase [Candidatus Glassbacteria bacterium]
MTLIALAVLSVLLIFTVSSFFDTNIVTNEEFTRKRNEMVSKQIVSRGVKDKRVLEAMRTVPRHLFVPEDLQNEAYGDYPLPIGQGQTISQPYIVALMTELLELEGDEKVLEIGTGSGYQAAVLSKLAKEVYTIEILPDLAVQAKRRLQKLGCLNVEVTVADGWKGLPLVGPFDAIIVTAAADSIPEALKEQLVEGGRLVIPLGPRGGVQELVLVTKHNGKILRKNITSVRFVPLVRQGESDN